MVLFLFRLTLILLVAISGGAHRPGNFEIIGPGGGGAMFHPTISPHDPNTVLLNCDMTGAYISHDGGKSWRMFNLRGVVEFFVFDPRDKKTIYAEAGGLWRSQDNGETWNLVYPNPASLKGIKMSSDPSDEELIADPNPLGSISAMAIDPENSKVFYVTARNRAKDSYALYTSGDGGESWVKVDDLPRLATRIYVNPFSTGADKSLVVAGLDFIEMRSASSTRQVPMPAGKEGTDTSGGFSGKASAVLYGGGGEF